MPTEICEPPRKVRACGYCIDEGREEPRVRPCDDVDYAPCEEHRRHLARALRLDTAGRD